MSRDRRLTAKQAEFVRQYLVDMNATAAARRAGYSPRTADRTGPELLGNPCVAAAIDAAVAERAARTQVDADRTLTELAMVGFSNIQDLVDAEGRLRPIESLPRNVAAAIASVEVVTRTIGKGEEAEIEYVHKIRLWDKNVALEKIAKHLGMLTDKVKVSGDAENPIAVMLQRIQGSTIQPVQPAMAGDADNAE